MDMVAELLDSDVIESRRGRDCARSVIAIWLFSYRKAEKTGHSPERDRVVVTLSAEVEESLV